MPDVLHAGATVHYEVDGTGPPLVLLHGLSLHGESWRAAGYLDALAGNYRCFSVDSRGAGRSNTAAAPAMYSLDLQVGDVLAILEEERLSAAAVWGFSYGGVIALACAAHAPPRVRAVVATGAWDLSPVTVDEIAAVAPAIETMRTDGVESWLGGWEDEQGPLPPWFRALVLTVDPASWLAARYGSFGWPEVRPDEVTCPTLVITGSREDPDGDAARWAACLPNGRCAVLPDRTHCGAFIDVTAALEVAVPFLERFAREPG